MNVLGLFLASALLTQAGEPFSETFGPGGETKAISGTFVDCSGRNLQQTTSAMEELKLVKTNEEAAYVMKLNKCRFVSEGNIPYTITQVPVKQCVARHTTKTEDYCKGEYYVFVLKGPDGRVFYAIYAPIYE